MQSQFVPLESALFGALEHIDVATKTYQNTTNKICQWINTLEL